MRKNKKHDEAGRARAGVVVKNQHTEDPPSLSCHARRRLTMARSTFLRVIALSILLLLHSRWFSYAFVVEVAKHHNHPRHCHDDNSSGSWFLVPASFRRQRQSSSSSISAPPLRRFGVAVSSRRGGGIWLPVGGGVALAASSSSSSSSSSAATAGPGGGGDRVRAATGIRPSLHPITINALATCLTERRRGLVDPSLPASTVINNDHSASAAPPTPTPLQVALQAGRVAAEALHQRRLTSKTDGTAFTELEESTVAGRIVGVAVRLDTLEDQLRHKCAQTPWIAKYQEWDAFGILPHETASSGDAATIATRLHTDPLWAVCRAECLLALYLHQVEGPELLQKNATVPGGSTVNFLDSDRLEVLLGNNSN